MKNLYINTFALFLLTAVLGCAAGFDSTVPADELINIIDPTPGRVQFGERWVRVDAFSDARSKDDIININGRGVKPDNVIATYVTRAFEDLLRINDFRLAQMHGPILRGEVLEWNADVKTGFPNSDMKAVASVRVMVVDDTGRTRFSSVYNGTTTLKHPFLTESRVKETLGDAMKNALDSVLKDNDFLQAVDEVRRGDVRNS